MDKNISIYELGKLAQTGDEVAMLEIINRKKKFIKRLSYGDEDRCQYIILKLIEAVKNYDFRKF